ncbi:hypothetical protein VPH35_013890 [Triticum aestivum]
MNVQKRRDRERARIWLGYSVLNFITVNLQVSTANGAPSVRTRWTLSHPSTPKHLPSLSLVLFLLRSPRQRKRKSRINQFTDCAWGLD